MTRSTPKMFLTLLLFAGAAMAAACGGSSGYSGTTSPTGTATAAADVTVTINGMAGAQSYSPNPQSLKVGQTVSWRNADNVAHTATGTGLDTGSIAPGATSAPKPMSTAGTLSYHCSFHPTMVGTLNVS
jgi:plastocyanin